MIHHGTTEESRKVKIIGDGSRIGGSGGSRLITRPTERLCPGGRLSRTFLYRGFEGIKFEMGGSSTLAKRKHL